jgi:glycosyltransferase involved in cell wall biosynthesis
METITEMTGSGEVPARLESATWPRIALVTPVLNSGRYIEQTIRSVLVQGYPNLDYFIVDGGSTDRTLDVIRKYENQISGWISEPDNGMYDAINKGFTRTSGEIMGWISATDMLHVGGLLVVGSVFRDLPEVEWILGWPSLFNEEGMAIAMLGGLTRWSRYRFLAGANRTIQQESTFWRRSLWEKAGGGVDASRRWAADFELWVRFFRHAQIYPVDGLIGGFRLHGDSLGLQDMQTCYRIHNEFIEAELDRMPRSNRVKLVRLVRRINRAVESNRTARTAWKRLVMNRLYHRPGRDWPPVIRYQQTKWRFVEK